MNLYIVNHKFHYELENLTRAFLPNDKINVVHLEGIPETSELPAIISSMEDETIKVSLIAEDFEGSRCSALTADNELTMATMLYELLCEYTGITLSWGLLTGVRPIKLLRRLKETMGAEEASQYFREKLLVSDEKLSLAEKTCEYEQKILDLSKRDSFSLYISIPFCPTRCSYCSFVSQSVEKAKHLISPYVDLLCEEIKRTAEITRTLGLRLETVYMGGGTPTTLEAEHLSRILSTVRENFDLSTLREFTVEAGRPDTITEEKLKAIIENGCDRLSVNPQTLNPKALESIGRKHTVEDFFRSFELSRKAGFRHINTDLIAGLPLDTPETFAETISGILNLAPESITIHTLSMKRSSQLTSDNMKLLREDAKAVLEMLQNGYNALCSKGYIPYYLYRQSRMVGNMENIGWSKPGFEGLYNVYIMDETHSIFSCGAGAVSKLRDPDSENIERIFNFKYPYEYNARFEELMERKNAIIPFYKSILAKGDI